MRDEAGMLQRVTAWATEDGRVCALVLNATQIPPIEVKTHT